VCGISVQNFSAPSKRSQNGKRPLKFLRPSILWQHTKQFIIKVAHCLSWLLQLVPGIRLWPHDQLSRTTNQATSHHCSTLEYRQTLQYWERQDPEPVAMDATIPLTGFNLASAQSLATERSYMCDAAQRDLRITHYKATQWITWWHENETNVWKM